jgi:hypothetical protein
MLPSVLKCRRSHDGHEIPQRFRFCDLNAAATTFAEGEKAIE